MSKISKTLKTKFPVLMFWLGKKKCLLSTFFYRNNPVKWTIKKYKKKYHVSLYLDNPSTFYEKMNYLKHFYFDEQETLLSDKYRVKEYLVSKGDEDIVPKALFSTSDIKELKKWVSEHKDKQFVIKTNHSCGDIFIYKNGVVTRKYGVVIKNINKVYRMLKIAIKYNHYYTCFESNYRYIKPLVFVEEYIDMKGALEYEFMTNYGEIKFVNVVNSRQSDDKSEILYDASFKSLSDNTKAIDKPIHYDYMKAFIKKHASNFPFCRVDFYETSKGLYFCEFTFIKSGGIGSLGNEELNISAGKLIDISKVVEANKTK